MEFLTQFIDENGKPVGPQFTLPVASKIKDLNSLINQFLENEEATPYSFYVDDDQLVDGLSEIEGKHSKEHVLKILYRPEATFSIKPVSFCSAKLPGHSQIVLCISFSPDGRSLVTGGGDGTVISWDISTQSLKQKIPIGQTWIQAIEWHASAKYVATGSTDGYIRILERNDETLELEVKRQIQASKQGKIFLLQWEPLHSCTGPLRLCAATDTGDIIMVDALTGNRLIPINGHERNNQIMCLSWGAHNVLYSASHDKTIKAWDTLTGQELSCFRSRSAWRTMSISTQFPLRTGPWELGKLIPITETGNELNDQIARSLLRLQQHEAKSPQEMIAVGNVDCTITLLTLDSQKNFKEIGRLPGHTKLVNHVLFSPNGYWLASASFDHGVKLWDGRSGRFICSLGEGRGKNTGRHVKEVYRIAWSPDSRQLLSGSADTTVKLWNVAKQKLHNDLAGHEDAIYAIDWNPAGYPAASGGKDKQVFLWR